VGKLIRDCVTQGACGEEEHQGAAEDIY